DSAALEQVSMTLEREVEYRIQQRVTGTHECSKRLAGRRDQVLPERNALIAGEHRLTSADLPIPVAHRCGHMCQLVPAGLTLACTSTKAFECLHEERLDVMRLQATGFGSLHLLTHACNAAGIHRIMGERAILEQFPQVAAVYAVLDSACKPS